MKSKSSWPAQKEKKTSDNVGNVKNNGYKNCVRNRLFLDINF